MRNSGLKDHVGELAVETSFNTFQCLAILAATTAFATFLPWSARFCVHDSDSLLPAIISVTKVTPYYWGQNRYGNLLPLLTAWIGDVRTNFMTQVVLRALLASSSPMLIMLIMRPRAPRAMAFGFTLVLLLVCLTPSAIQSYWVDAQPYGISAALLSAAIAAANVEKYSDIRRAAQWAIAFAMLLLAMWVNLSLILIAGPLFAVLALVLRSARIATLALLSLLAYAIMAWHAHLVGGDQHLGFAPSWTNVAAACAAMISVIRSGPLMLIVGVAAALGLVVLQRRYRAVTGNSYCPFVVGAVVLTISAIGAALVIANIEWVALNLFYPRYFLLPLVIVISTCGVVLAEILWLGLPVAVAKPYWWATVATAASIAMVAAATLPLDVACPSYSVEANTAARQISAWPERFDVTFVAGDYLIVWPIVFDMMRHNEGRRVFGLTFRGDAAVEAARNALATSHSAGMVCFEARPEDCIERYERFVGTVNERTLKGPMSVIASGTINGSSRPYQIIRLLPPHCMESDPACADPAGNDGAR